MRECATVGKLLGKVWSHPLPPPTADKKVLSFTKFLKFSFTGNTKPAMPAKIFLFAGCYIGGRPHPSTGGLIFNRRTPHFSRGNNVQSVTSSKNAKPEKTRILKKFIMQALDLYSTPPVQALILCAHKSAC